MLGLVELSVESSRSVAVLEGGVKGGTDSCRRDSDSSETISPDMGDNGTTAGRKARGLFGSPGLRNGGVGRVAGDN